MTCQDNRALGSGPGARFRHSASTSFFCRQVCSLQAECRVENGRDVQWSINIATTRRKAPQRLLGIVFVVEEHVDGAKLAFRYPPSPPPPSDTYHPSSSSSSSSLSSSSPSSLPASNESGNNNRVCYNRPSNSSIKSSV